MRLTGPGPSDFAPLDAASFAVSMQAFAPFEPAPVVAVGVSGGPDSMALALLLDDWARARGGSVLALTVDHGLRAESAAEAAQVVRWLAARGIAHEILRWVGEKPATGIQNAARDARYALLAAACAERGILHLATAHHADDQAETVLFRRQGGSGPDGLAGMSATRSLGDVRLIRPLLAWPKSALAAVCAAHGQPAIDDPSNRASRFARTGLREALANDPDAAQDLLRTATTEGAARAARERNLDNLLGRIATAYPHGSVELDRAGWTDAPVELRLAALAAALRTVGGGVYPVDAEPLARLEQDISQAGMTGSSLGGCLIQVHTQSLLICREPGRTQPAKDLIPGTWQRWDGRFLLRAQAAGLSAGPLGQGGYADLKKLTGTRLPAIIGASLPVILQENRPVAVPSLGWRAPGGPVVEQRFSPRWPLASERFTVVCEASDIICDGRDRGINA